MLAVLPVRVVWSLGLGALLTSGALLGAVVVTRALTARRVRSTRALSQRWTPAFLGIDELPPPPSRPTEARNVLALWNQLRAAIRGPAAATLEDRARQVGLDHVAADILRRPRREDDLISAVAAIGLLGHAGHRPALLSLAADEAGNAVLRAEALRAIVRLDPATGLTTAVEVLIGWHDWHPAVAASVLDEADHDAAAALVGASAAAALDVDSELAQRLLRTLTAFPRPPALAAVRAILDSGPEPSIRATCLWVLGRGGDAADHERVVRHLDDEAWFVRVQATAALGMVGSLDDEARLQTLLDDDEWWVRQRAAESLTRVVALDPDQEALELAREVMTALYDDHGEVGRFAATPYSSSAELLR